MNCLFFVAFSHLWLSLLAVGAAAVLPVQITTNAGDRMEGDLVAVTEAGIELSQSGVLRSLPAEELMSLKVTDSEKNAGPPTRISLANGSQIWVNRVETDGTKMILKPSLQTALELPIKQVKAIRFQKPSTATDAAWLGMIDKPTRGDTLVIRRPGDRLDPTNGIVLSISEGRVQFDLDGEKVAAPIERLEGIIFGGTDIPDASANMVVTDIHGSTWMATSFVAARIDKTIQFNLDSQTTHEMPTGLLRSVRWAGGLMMLATNEPAESMVKTSIPIQWKDDLANQWFGPEAAGQQDSETESSAEKNDLIMRGGSVIQYRVDKGYRLFSGTVRRSEDIKTASQVVVRIRLDDKVAWQNGLPNADAQGFELELGDARRVTIEIDSGDDGDLGTVVRLVRPRLVK